MTGKEKRDANVPVRLGARVTEPGKQRAKTAARRAADEPSPGCSSDTSPGSAADAGVEWVKRPKQGMCRPGRKQPPSDAPPSSPADAEPERPREPAPATEAERVRCPHCDGARTFDNPDCVSDRIVCHICHGLGTVPKETLAQIAAETDCR
jgi:hypothetical protein